MLPFARVGAFAVHVLTAVGAALALGALIYAVHGQWAAMFLCLAVALLVDGVDGTIARRLKVAERLPRWSGDVLDLVVDFVTYVFVPAYAIAAGGLLPQPLGVPAGVVVVITGALYFADRNMKTADNYFRGFPALWNVAAFYLFLLRPAPWLAAAAVAVLSILTFVPFKFVHPVRVLRLRALSIGALLLWSMLALGAIFADLDPGPWVAGALVVIGCYFLAIGLTEKR
ncbi:MAG TPA: CDP-alcohol phosphatidyltransferase family protein [Xanthobacteraceae bacterium]